MVAQESMTDATIQAIVAGCVTLGLAWIAGRKLNAIAKTGEATHSLVNSNFGIQLKLTSVVSRRLADLTNAPADIEAADLAKRAYDAHMAQQAIVDAKEGKVA